jgi:hypothetical protein
MALLAYLVFVAFIMTSAFVGFEWIATSAPRTVAHHLSPAKSAVVIQKRKTYLAAHLPWNSSASAKQNLTTISSKESSEESKEIASNEESKPQDSSAQTPRSAHAHRNRPKIAIRRARDAAGQTAFGYGAPRVESNGFFGGFWQGGGTP